MVVALPGAVAGAVDADPDGDGALGVATGEGRDDDGTLDVGDAAAIVVGAGPVVGVLGRATGEHGAGVVLAAGSLSWSGGDQGGCEGEGCAVLHSGDDVCRDRWEIVVWGRDSMRGWSCCFIV